jgi:acyl carrier protein
MVAFLEERFGVQVPDEDVVFENFQSIKTMSDYVKQRKATPSAGAR